MYVKYLEKMEIDKKSINPIYSEINNKGLKRQKLKKLHSQIF